MTTTVGRIVEALARNGFTLAVAESCTGGGLGEILTRVPGVSKVFSGGVIAYADEIKIRLLGVPEKDLMTNGAVSAPTARSMAAGVRRRFGTDFGLAITGIAGPGGGTPRRPVGLVWIALAAPDGIVAWRFRFSGGRQEVRRNACRAALDRLQRKLSREQEKRRSTGHATGRRRRR